MLVFIYLLLNTITNFKSLTYRYVFTNDSFNQLKLVLMSSFFVPRYALHEKTTQR